MDARMGTWTRWFGFGLLAFAFFQLLTDGAWVAFAILGALMLVLSRAGNRVKGGE